MYNFFRRGFDGEVIDMKNGFVYFISNHLEVGLNYHDVDLMCANYPKLTLGKKQYAAGFDIVFFSDQQIRDFLNLFKMSKLLA